MTSKLVQQDLQGAPTVEAQDAILKSAYASGFTLQELGDIVGVTRERIRQRISKPVPVAFMKNYPPPKRVQRRETQARKSRKKRKRILGLRMSSTALQVPASTLNELSRLRDLTTTVRGWTPLDDPARLAIKPFGELLWKTVNDYEVPVSQLEKLMGVSTGTLRAWLRSHGYIKQAPSQRSYRGIEVAKGPRGTALTIGAKCRHGHTMTEENIGYQKAGRYCKDCSRANARARYQRRKQENSNI